MRLATQIFQICQRKQLHVQTYYVKTKNPLSTFLSIHKLSFLSSAVVFTVLIKVLCQSLWYLFDPFMLFFS